MSKSKKNGRSHGSARYVMLYHWMMRTPAWQSLDGNARAIYLEILSRYAGVNNGRIPYAVRDAVKSLRIGLDTAARALRVLQERGFIVAMTKGGFICKVRRATEWRLTDFACDVTNVWATKDFSKWSPEIKNTVPIVEPTAPVAVPNGTCSRTIPFQKAA